MLDTVVLCTVLLFPAAIVADDANQGNTDIPNTEDAPCDYSIFPGGCEDTRIHNTDTGSRSYEDFTEDDDFDAEMSPLVYGEYASNIRRKLKSTQPEELPSAEQILTSSEENLNSPPAREQMEPTTLKKPQYSGHARANNHLPTKYSKILSSAESLKITDVKMTDVKALTLQKRKVKEWLQTEVGKRRVQSKSSRLSRLKNQRTRSHRAHSAPTGAEYDDPKNSSV